MRRRGCDFSGNDVQNNHRRSEPVGNTRRIAQRGRRIRRKIDRYEDGCEELLHLRSDFSLCVGLLTHLCDERLIEFAKVGIFAGTFCQT